MANRGITSQALLDAINDQVVTFYEMFEITTVQNGSDVVYRLTNAPQDITYDSNTYKAFGQYIGAGAVEENANQDIPQIKIQISGIAPYESGAIGESTDTSFMQTILADTTTYIDQPVKMFRAFYGLNNAQIGSFLLFEGQTVSASIEYDNQGISAVNMTVSSHWVNFQRYTGRFTNTNSQQSFFPNDTGLDKAERVQKDIIWQQPPE